MYEYPFGNGQQLNLDWFLSEWKNLLAAWEAEKNGVEGALQAEIDRAEAALADVFAARDAAAQSAANALESKNAAAQSASDASGYLSTVQQNATAAQDAARNAAQSESDAADSAQTAVASKNAAGQSERNAAQSEANARASKDAAAQSVADALANKDAAAQSAADALANKNAAAQSAEDASDAAASVEASAQQIATNTANINKINNRSQNFVEVQATGRRISINALNNTNNNVTKIVASFEFSSSDAIVNTMSIETSAFDENGGVLYEQTPVPGNIIIKPDMIANGVIVIISAELIGNNCIVSYIIIDKTTQSIKFNGDQISHFSNNAKTLRSCVLWHYINDASVNCYYQLNGDGNWVVTSLN